MGYPTRVQLIQRKQSEQWYINFPAALAQAMQFRKGEIAEWFVEDLNSLVLRRTEPPSPPLKKKHRTGSSPTSTNSGSHAGTRSPKNGPGLKPKASS